MNGLQDIHVKEEEKYTLDGPNKFTLMKHKRREHMNDAITIITVLWLYKCTDLQNGWGVMGGCEDHGSFKLQTSQARSYFSCEGNSL